MAQRKTIDLIDDLDNTSPATQTITLGLDGITYEIDLTQDHADQLRTTLQPWASAARRTGGRRKSTTHATGHGTGDNAAIRTWAQQQGLQISDRGRISAEIREAYNKAHAGN